MPLALIVAPVSWLGEMISSVLSFLSYAQITGQDIFYGFRFSVTYHIKLLPCFFIIIIAQTFLNNIFFSDLIIKFDGLLSRHQKSVQ